jgi:hypothetical protein
MWGRRRWEPLWQRLAPGGFERFFVHAATLCGNGVADKPNHEHPDSARPEPNPPRYPRYPRSKSNRG